MTKVLALLRSRWVRLGFVVVAVAAATIAVVQGWDDIRPALSAVPPALIAGALALNLVYLMLTMLSWRAVLGDLGSHLAVRPAFAIFFVSQLGKYVPGGVWNIVAASELGADQQIPRRRSLSAMAVTVLVSIVSGLAVAVPALLIAGTAGIDVRWVWLAVPAALVALSPPVLNRLLALAMRIARREPLEHPLTSTGTLAATAWSVAAWLVVGVQVWMLSLAVGMMPTLETYLLATGSYALAWIVGFVVVFVPAGLGARELVLAALLAGYLDPPAVLVVVLVSRLVQTMADLVMAGLGFGAARRGRHAEVTPPG